VLVIDRDRGIHRMLRLLLKGERCEVIWAPSGARGLAKATASRPVLIIIDWALPDMDGMKLLKTLRGWYRAPILVLSTPAGEEDKARALLGGADGYAAKPFDDAELLARLRALLHPASVFVADACFGNKNLWFNPATREVTVDGRPLKLTPIEEMLFHMLARQVNNPVDCRQLVLSIWGSSTVAKLKELRIYIMKLRRKLKAGGAGELIKSDGAVGYCLMLKP